VALPHRLTLKDHTGLLRRDTWTGQAEPLDTGQHYVTAFAFGVVHSVPVAALGRADATVVLRDLRDGAVIGGPFLLPNAANALAFSPDGHLAICFDGDITVWRARRA